MENYKNHNLKNRKNHNFAKQTISAMAQLGPRCSGKIKTQSFSTSSLASPIKAVRGSTHSQILSSSFLSLPPSSAAPPLPLLTSTLKPSLTNSSPQKLYKTQVPKLLRVHLTDFIWPVSPLPGIFLMN